MTECKKKKITNKQDKMKYASFAQVVRGVVFPSIDRTTVHSESATEFTSGFPSYRPREVTHFPFYPMPTTHITCK